MRRLCVMAMAVGLAACGSGGEPATSSNDSTPAATTASGGTDPCSLITAEEVSAIVGEPIVATEPGEGRCEYQTADAQASSVVVELDQSDAGEAMEIARTAAGTLSDIGGAVADQGGAGADANAMLSESGAAPKLGDESFFGANQQLMLRKGNSYVAISPPMMRSRMAEGNPMLSADAKKTMAVAIAEKIVPRLP